MILDQDFKSKLQNDYRSFFKSEKTYKDLAVPWKRGLIFLGVSHGLSGATIILCLTFLQPPGNGKTVSLKAVMKDAQDKGIPCLYVKTLHCGSLETISCPITTDTNSRSIHG